MPNSIDERRQGAYRPFVDLELVDGQTTEVRNAWPVRRQTYGYLPERLVHNYTAW